MTTVCMFGSEIAPSKDDVYVGGSVVSAVNLSRHLDEQDNDVSVYTTRPRDWDVYEPVVETDWGTITVADTNAKNIGVVGGGVSISKLTRGLIQHCRKNNIDIIHGHSGFPIVTLIPVLAGKYLDIPVVHSLYCPVPEENQTGLRQRLSSPYFTRQLISRVQHTFAMTDNVAQSLHRSGVSDVSVLRPIVDCETYRPDLDRPESVAIEDNRITILFVGNLKEEKGLDFLIEAAGTVNESTPVQLIITTERDFEGSNERAPTIRKLIEQNGLAENVDWLDIIPDMPRVISHADVLVVPFTNTDGPSDNPLAALEAMAAETPVVGTSVGGIEKLLSEGRGCLAPPEDSQALAKALLRATKMPDVEQREIRAYIENTFSPDEVYGTVEQVYGDCL